MLLSLYLYNNIRYVMYVTCSSFVHSAVLMLQAIMQYLMYMHPNWKPIGGGSRFMTSFPLPLRGQLARKMEICLNKFYFTHALSIAPYYSFKQSVFNVEFSSFFSYNYEKQSCTLCIYMFNHNQLYKALSCL